jgi:hypothetical protein
LFVLSLVLLSVICFIGNLRLEKFYYFFTFIILLNFCAGGTAASWFIPLHSNNLHFVLDQGWISLTMVTLIVISWLLCSPQRNSVSIIWIHLREVIKCLKFNDLSQTNSNNTHWVSFGETRYPIRNSELKYALNKCHARKRRKYSPIWVFSNEPNLLWARFEILLRKPNNL